MCNKLNKTIKKNGGRNNYGQDVIWTFVEYENYRCENENNKDHSYYDCNDCGQMQHWSCSGCNEGEDVHTFHKPNPSYRIKLKCDICGAGWYKSDEEKGISPAMKEEMEWNQMIKQYEENK